MGHMGGHLVAHRACSGDVLLLGDPSSAIPVSPLPQSTIAFEHERPPKRVAKSYSLATDAASDRSAAPRPQPDMLIPRVPDLSNLHVAAAAARQRRGSYFGSARTNVRGEPAATTRAHASAKMAGSQAADTTASLCLPAITEDTASEHRSSGNDDGRSGAVAASVQAPADAAASDSSPQPGVGAGFADTSGTFDTARELLHVSSPGGYSYEPARSRAHDAPARDPEEVATQQADLDTLKPPFDVQPGAEQHDEEQQQPEEQQDPEASRTMVPTPRLPPDTFTTEHLLETVNVEERCRAAPAAPRAGVRSVLLSAFATHAAALRSCQQTVGTNGQRPASAASSVYRAQTIATGCGPPLATEVQSKCRRPHSAAPFHKREHHCATSYTSKVCTQRVLLGRRPAASMHRVHCQHLHCCSHESKGQPAKRQCMRRSRLHACTSIYQ